MQTITLTITGPQGAGKTLLAQRIIHMLDERPLYSRHPTECDVRIVDGEDVTHIVHGGKK